MNIIIGNLTNIVMAFICIHYIEYIHVLYRNKELSLKLVLLTPVVLCLSGMISHNDNGCLVPNLAQRILLRGYVKGAEGRLPCSKDLLPKDLRCENLRRGDLWERMGWRTGPGPLSRSILWVFLLVLIFRIFVWNMAS